MPEGEPELLTRVENGVLWITLNRPEAQNALTWPMRDGIADLMNDASADLGVRSVVLTATGKGFCTGADLRSRPAPPERPPGAPDRPVGDASRTMRRGWQRLISAILDCEKPVIAAVNGTAAGGGMHLALACDLVLMAEGARFISVFVRRGLIPDGGGVWILPRIVGLQKAREIMFFGDDIGAADAVTLGLANRVVPGAELEATAREWAERLARGPTKAIGMTKWLVNRSFDIDRRTALEEEAWAVEIMTQTEDSQEGVASFVERRDPEFKGW